MYLIIDKQYRIYKSPSITGYIRNELKKGNLSVVNLGTMEGMNIDGVTFSPIQDWDTTFKVDE